MKEKLKILIDMDIGDDIDDAFALLLAMDMGIEIVGITTVFKNTAERARLTKKLLKLYGKGYENVPVYAGYGKPLRDDADEKGHLCQYTPDLDDEAYTPDCVCPERAVDFIIECCKKYGKELTVVAIGPFTNIAKVIEKAPDALSLAGRVLIMGGAYFRQYADWNVSCDPEAAKIMFESLKGIHCLGADVTHKLKLSRTDDKKIEEYNGSNPALKYISELYRLWKIERDGRIGILHDPLAIYYSKDPSVCECNSSAVAVITDGYARGITLNLSEYTKAYMNPDFCGYDFTRKQTLAYGVDSEKITKRFMKCFDK